MRQELALLRGCPDTIVMIDDFQVSADPRFGWDKYDDAEIYPGHIADLVDAHDVHWPSDPATQEEAT